MDSVRESLRGFRRYPLLVRYSEHGRRRVVRNGQCAVPDDRHDNDRGLPELPTYHQQQHDDGRAVRRSMRVAGRRRRRLDGPL